MKLLTKNRLLFIYSLIIFVVIQVLYSLGVLNNYYMQIIDIALINIILATSLNIINGFTGQFSLGHGGFMAVGAYTAGVLTTLIFKVSQMQTLPKFALFFVAIILGGILAAVIGILLGIPSLRLRGDYLAIVTLAFQEIVRVSINAIDYVGGPRGLLGIPRLSTFPVIFFTALISIFVLKNVVYSTIGRAMKSIREDEVASELVGVNTTKYKVMAFSIGAFFAGVAGALLVHVLQLAHPTMFGFTSPSIAGPLSILVMVYIGGAGSLSGSIIAAVVLTVLSELLRLGIDALNGLHILPFTVGPEWRMVLYAVLLIVVMLYRTEGIMGQKEFGVLVPEEEEKNATGGS
ncbi:MAG: branched-chain amino acid ABC transporter permease [Caldisericum sp.]|uniref:branched-chain amino acid ABC transporter permease n=1 Tax=Caldisericum TaxID=693074 RepID=UPI0039FC649C